MRLNIRAKMEFLFINGNKNAATTAKYFFFTFVDENEFQTEIAAIGFQFCT